MYIDRVMLDIGLKVQKFKSNEFLKKKDTDQLQAISIKILISNTQICA